MEDGDNHPFFCRSHIEEVVATQTHSLHQLLWQIKQDNIIFTSDNTETEEFYPHQLLQKPLTPSNPPPGYFDVRFLTSIILLSSITSGRLMLLR